MERNVCYSRDMRSFALVFAIASLTACGEDTLPLDGETCVHAEARGGFYVEGIENWEVIYAVDPGCRDEAEDFVEDELLRRNGWEESRYRFQSVLADPFPLDAVATLRTIADDQSAPRDRGYLVANVYCRQADLDRVSPSSREQIRSEVFSGLTVATGDMALDGDERYLANQLLNDVYFATPQATIIGGLFGSGIPLYIDGTGRPVCVIEEEIRPGESEVSDCGTLPGRTRIDGELLRCSLTLQPNPPQGPGFFPETTGGLVPHPDERTYIRLAPTADAFLRPGTTVRFNCLTAPNTCEQ